MVTRRALQRGARVVGTILEKVVKQKLSHVDVSLVKLRLRDLWTAKFLTSPLSIRVSERLNELMLALPRLAEKFQMRRQEVTHLFGAGLEVARKDFLKRDYLSRLDELRDLARSEEFQRLIQVPKSRDRIAKYARDNMQGLSGIVDRYGDLYRESYALNALTRRLYPGSAIDIGVRLDAQHVIEKRTFDKFVKDWALLGWQSKEDMPAMVVMHDWHIPSPKNLPGLKDVRLKNDTIPIEDVFSLTKEMERELPLEKFKKVEDYLSAVKKFYSGSPIKDAPGVVPRARFVALVEQVEKELYLARTRAELVKQAKALKQK